MRFSMQSAALMLLGLLATAANAQSPVDQNAEDERDPLHKHWEWMFEVRLPDKIDGPYVAIPLSAAVLGTGQIPGAAKESRELGDVRLTDAKGNRIPYALRTMNARTQQTPVTIKRQFNAAPSAKARVYQASFELADLPDSGHNEIEVYTTGGGRDYRRKVEVLGDDDEKFANAKSLLGKGQYLVHYEFDNKVIDIRRFRYDLMKYKYLQVRVHADDASVDEEIPKIARVIVRRSVDVPGEYVTEPANLLGPDQVRGEGAVSKTGEPDKPGGPATAWYIVFTERIPCEMLTFEISSPPSERPMRLEIANPDEPRIPVNRVDWAWRIDKVKDANQEKKEDAKPGEQEPAQPQRSTLEVRFDEVVAKRLRLVVTDYANPPLQINSVKATRAARKLIFEKPAEKVAQPLRLFVGHSTIGPARYDLEDKLNKKFPYDIKPAPAIATLGERVQNPAFEPPPKQLHERFPWLVYVVLGAASLVLLLILLALARQAITRDDETKSKTEPAQA